MNKVFWLQPEDSKIGGVQKLISDRAGSPSFCVIPWIHMATRPNGDARLCCVTNASGAATGDHQVGLVKKENGRPANFGVDTPLSAWNNEYMRDVRTTMLEGKIPASCSKCFEEESNGVSSKRIWEAYDWTNNGLDIEKLISDTEEDGTVPPVIRYLDLRLGHTCNLKCVMCSPHDSSRWVQDYEPMMAKTKSQIVINQINWDKSTFNNYWYEKPEFWDDVFEQIPHIEQLYFAGGEPLMIKEHKRFLEEIIRRGYNHRITLRYNSNGVLLDEDMIAIWTQFKKVKYSVSVDAVGDRNWYIRYPTEWDEIIRVLERLDNTPDNIQTSIECAVQAINAEHLPDFARWMIEQNYKKVNKHYLGDYQAGGGIFSMHLLFIPTFLSARVLTKAQKDRVRVKFAELKQWLWDNYTQDDAFWHNNPYGWKRWEGILKFIDAEDHSHMMPDFIEYFENLDSIRSTNFKTTFPELE
jgi:sulfatase maturation enzyme AslB (radical SAM superfamily)